MAIEKVYFLNNTSVIHDEIFAHRLGLVPIYADPKRFNVKLENEEINDQNTIVFELKVKCDKKQSELNGNCFIVWYYFLSFLLVYSGDLKWIPQGSQSSIFENSPIRPVNTDILLAKMRPGQEICLEAHCEKNIGREHAKWSPVCTATYRILPTITLLEPITGELAYKFASCFASGVVAVEAIKGNFGFLNFLALF